MDLDNAPQDGGPPSDADLVRVHQEKVDARLREINESLEDIDRSARAAASSEAKNRKSMAKSEAKRAALLARPVDTRRERRHIETTVQQGLSNFIGKAVKSQEILKSKREPLERERRALQRRITLADFSSAPVRRVPADIMIEIFTRVKSMADEDELAIAATARLEGMELPQLLSVGRDPATTLSHVCREWRAIACAHAALWASFSFPLFAEGMTALTAVYLERARSFPLTIEIISQPPKQDAALGAQAIELLAKFSDNLLDLRLVTVKDQPYGSTGNAVEALPPFEALYGKLPRLQILQLPQCAAFGAAFELAPSLHTLRLCSYGKSGWNDPDPAPKFDSGVIRSLTVDGHGPRRIPPFDNLTDLTSHVPLSMDTTPNANAVVWPPPTLLPDLKSWTIKFEGYPRTRTQWAAPRLFPLFTTPALHTLDISFLHHPEEFLPWLRNATFHLTKLVLRNSNIRVSSFAQILEQTPDLETLAIVDGFSTMLADRFMHFLADPVNIPQLASLTISGAFAFGNLSLVQMLESRIAARQQAGSVVGLRDVFLSFPQRVIPADLVERIRALKNIELFVECFDDSNVMYRAL
ncbi:hypothetical protein DFH06DRAFT_1380042 [Mycena polygramma]|nr:hypothetical protein DFH06DRAFT_1380042 [Mycena polygramma]